MRRTNTVLLMVLYAATVSVYGEDEHCPNVTTSEGVVTLLHGQKACAPLGGGETDADKGARFLTCYDGTVLVMDCDASHRFDVETEVCETSGKARCKLDADPRARLRRSSKPDPHAGTCNDTNCNLPNCFCYNAEPKMPLADRPQFVMVTFDDYMTNELYDKFYKAMFVDNTFQVFNPTGCPLRAGFFVCDNYSNYSKVMELWRAGNEIGSHTMTHKLPPGIDDTDYPEMVAEIEGFRQKILQVLGKQVFDSINGFRAPHLRVAHNVQYDVLRDYRFLYDTSVTSMEMWFGKKPLWPCTLDHILGRCINPPCPTKKYPGIWEIIMNAWVGDDGHPCSMADSCLTYNYSTATQDDWEKLFDKNFQIFHKTRVPIGFFVHGPMFKNSPKSYDALGHWLRRMTKNHPNIWVVTPQLVVQWMQSPLTNAEMKAQRWGCQQQPVQKTSPSY